MFCSEASSACTHQPLVRNPLRSQGDLGNAVEHLSREGADFRLVGSVQQHAKGVRGGAPVVVQLFDDPRKHRLPVELAQHNGDVCVTQKGERASEFARQQLDGRSTNTLATAPEKHVLGARGDSRCETIHKGLGQGRVWLDRGSPVGDVNSEPLGVDPIKRFAVHFRRGLLGLNNGDQMLQNPRSCRGCQLSHELKGFALCVFPKQIVKLLRLRCAVFSVWLR